MHSKKLHSSIPRMIRSEIVIDFKLVIICNFELYECNATPTSAVAIPAF